ncbi:hypothetical protein RJ639_008218 [Escallonia herrerae]|nr:hypothetical protein RJ639_008218 [Escallonia herrerae]
MILVEKIGQMTQIDGVSATAEILKEYSIGSLLSGGASVPLPHATVEEWINMMNGESKRKAMPIHDCILAGVFGVSCSIIQEPIETKNYSHFQR